MMVIDRGEGPVLDYKPEWIEDLVLATEFLSPLDVSCPYCHWGKAGKPCRLYPKFSEESDEWIHPECEPHKNRVALSDMLRSTLVA